MCHCLACQKRTGSIFAVQARFHREDVRSIDGNDCRFVRVGDSGGRATFHFCPSCGSTVYYEADWMPGFVAVPVGAFADPDFPPPKVVVYEERRHPWAVMPGLVTENDGE